MSDRIAVSIAQFVHAWRLFAAGAAAPRLSSDAGMECVFSGVAIPFFNVVIFTGRELSDEGLVRQAGIAREWTGGHLPWVAVTTEERMARGANAAAAMDTAGFAPVMQLFGMETDRVDPVSRLPEGLSLHLTDDDSACEAMLDVNAEAYAMPFDAAMPVWGRQKFWNDHVLVIGRKDGVAVSSTAVLVVDGYRYVALVATRPGHQRRGYADAAMRQALALSEQKYGPLPTFLHASEAGRPVYERMGYRQISRHTIFMDKAMLGGH